MSSRPTPIVTKDDNSWGGWEFGTVPAGLTDLGGLRSILSGVETRPKRNRFWFVLAVVSREHKAAACPTSPTYSTDAILRRRRLATWLVTQRLSWCTTPTAEAQNYPPQSHLCRAGS